MEYRKELLANVSIFDGKDKKLCLMWLNQCIHTAINAKMSLRGLIVAKLGPIVSTQVQNFLCRVPEATDAQIKQHILECFSNVGTRTEAHHYLTRMTLDEDESLLAHNSEYAALHEAAHGIAPEEERSEIALMDYVRTLPQITCNELTKQITRQESKIHNLRQAMNMAKSLDRQARQRELNRQERNALRETTIREEAVNEMSIQEEVNFMSGRNDGRFNSTMKNNSGCWNNSPNRNNSYHGDRNNSYYGGRNNSYQGRNSSYSDNRSDRNYSDNKSWNNNKSWNPRYNYSDNYDSRRRLNRYKHQSRDPKNKIKFEYNIADKEMFSTLRSTVDQLKEHRQANRHTFKKIPDVTKYRNREEVREDTIAEMRIEELQDILRDHIDLIFNALVIHDYIEEVDAWLPSGYEPESYFTCIPEKEEIYKIDETKSTEEGTVFETSINNTKMKTLFDTGATKSIMSGKMWRDLKLGPLDDRNLPSVVGANGSSLGALGRIRCTIAFEKDEDKFDQTFLVCENLQRGVILGKDFARQNCVGVYWTPHNTRVLHTNLKTIAETKELLPSGTAAIHVKQTTKLPPRSLAVVDVNINMTSEDKIRMVPDSLCQSRHPNMYMMGFDVDLSKRKKDTVAPFVLINLSHTENLRLRKDTVVSLQRKTMQRVKYSKLKH